MQSDKNIVCMAFFSRLVSIHLSCTYESLAYGVSLQLGYPSYPTGNIRFFKESLKKCLTYFLNCDILSASDRKQRPNIKKGRVLNMKKNLKAFVRIMVVMNGKQDVFSSDLFQPRYGSI